MSTINLRIVEELPQLRTEIIDRLVGDPDFQALCHDYDRCHEALAGFQAQADVLSQRITEYEQLLAQLKEEIRRCVEDRRRAQ